MDGMLVDDEILRRPRQQHEYAHRSREDQQPEREAGWQAAQAARCRFGRGASSAEPVHRHKLPHVGLRVNHGYG